MSDSNFESLMRQRNQYPMGFIECDTCRAKSGSPTLCLGCLHNRWVIGRLLKLPLIICDDCYLIDIGRKLDCKQHPGRGR